MNIKASKIGNVAGIVSLVAFGVCMLLWGSLMATPELKLFHTEMLQVYLPGYSPSVGGVAIGLVESYIYGWLMGAGFVWLCRKICK